MTVVPPPSVQQLPLGYQLRAGLGHSEVLATVDVESYSEAGYVWSAAKNRWQKPKGAQKPGLPAVGAAAYWQHPTTEVLSLQYDLRDGRGARLWLPGQPVPADWCAHVAAGGLVEAHNAAFEGWAFRCVLGPRHGWPAIPPRQMRCSMAKARSHSLPGKLAEAGKVLRLAVQKDKEGEALLKRFAMPRNPTIPDPRRRIRPDEDPARVERLYAYNGTDVYAEEDLSAAVPDLPPAELEYWFVDQAVNTRGMGVDVAKLHACITIVEEAHRRYDAELCLLTAGRVPKSSQLPKMKAWFSDLGVHMDSMDEAALNDAMKRPDLPAAVRRALEIRSIVGSASVKKVYAMRNGVTKAGRLHDLYMFHGAHTGRPVGVGPQPTNLPNSGPAVYQCAACERHFGAHAVVCPWCSEVRGPGPAREWNPRAVEDCLTVIACESLDLLAHMFGPDVMYSISGCLRGLFVPAEGRDMICSDYTAIEAVVAAAVAGEQWRLDVFNTHGKIYEATASAMYGVPLEEMLEYKRQTGEHHPLRKKGKIAELAFGYQGWIGSATAFGMPGSETEIKNDILAWRASSPSIEFMWGGQKSSPAQISFHRAAVAAGGAAIDPGMLAAHRSARRWDHQPYLFGLEGAFIEAVTQPGTPVTVRRLDGTACGLSYLMPEGQDVVYALWHGERLITYHAPRVKPSRDAWRGLSCSYEGWNTNPKMGPVGWIRKDTWGGRLFENDIQAIANRIFRHAKIALEAAGYENVMHTYDELCAEVDEGFGSVEEFEAIMCDTIWWAKAWPIRAAGGWRGKRYRK